MQYASGPLQWHLQQGRQTGLNSYYNTEKRDLVAKEQVGGPRIQNYPRGNIRGKWGLWLSNLTGFLTWVIRHHLGWG